MHSQASKHTTAHPLPSSSSVVHTACSVLQALLSSFPAEAAGEMVAGRGLGALVKLVDASCAAAATAAASEDADLNQQIINHAVACLDTIMQTKEEEAVHQVCSCKTMLSVCMGE